MLKIEPAISISRLADVPLFMPALPHANRRRLENAAKQHNLQLNIRSDVDRLNLIKAMI